MNGFNNGSILGFTLSIPSNASMSDSGFSNSTLTGSQKKSANGLSCSNTSVFTEKIATKENHKSCAETKISETEALVIQDKKQFNSGQGGGE